MILCICMEENYIVLRKNFQENDDRRDADFCTPEDVVRFDDITYGPDATWNVLDVYRPKDNESVLPVIVSVHGGGFVYGDKERYQYYCMDLAKRGFAVVNFSYRLAPENKFPAPLVDMTMVLSWMSEHADEYGMDSKNVFAVGDSAGGHILAMYAAAMSNLDYANILKEKYGLTVCADIKFKGVGLNCGEYMGSASKEIMQTYLPVGDAEEYSLVDLPQYITEAFPPAYMMTAPADFLKTSTYGMVKAFTERNVPFVLRMYGNSERPLGHVFHCDLKLPEATQCNDDECSFFRSLM